MRVLVTGCTSLIVRYFLNKLYSTQDKFGSFEFYFFNRTSPSFFPEKYPFSFSHFSGDCSSINDWIECLKLSSPDIIIHAAQMLYTPNLLSALDYLSMCPKLIIVGSTGVFSKFDSCSLPYRLGELALSKSKRDYVVIRPSMIYGSSFDRNMHKLVMISIKGRPFFLPSSGRSLFQPVHYTDVGHSIYIIFRRIVNGEFKFPIAFNVVGPNRASLLDIVSVINALSYSRSHVFLIPTSITSSLAPVLALLPPKLLPVTSEQLLRLSEDKVFDNDWNDIDSSHKPIGLVSGLKMLIDEILYSS